MMTPDTRRALDLIQPIADKMGITVGANEQYLFCDNQKIAIRMNSTLATVREFFAYALWLEGDTGSPRWKMPAEYEEKIRACWVRGGEPDA